ncbi:MAG: PEP-CTERM sorting domain-containing protein [Gammaproteobacteria bacterium]|nr:PEP-CTERM sorting domain-containing protein [Gammaproteobacteria bacterium]
MKGKRLTLGLTLLCVAQMVSAGVIDTRPPNASLSYFIFSGPDSAGGTFFADANTLDSFSLILGGGTSGDFRAIVFAADGAGNPTGPLLYESADTAIPGVQTEFTFTPGLSISTGSEYFIGFDTGLFTTASGGDIDMWFSANVISGIKSENLNGTGFSLNPNRDIASRIVMSDRSVPEPGSAVLLLVGLAGMRLGRRGKGSPGTGQV